MNAGLALSGVGADYDGRVRPRGGRVDIGAYEHPDSSSRTARLRAKSKRSRQIQIRRLTRTV